jgi:transcriptional regulator with XRE-family HTH domain
MSVNSVFGNNLRQLARERGSLTRVAEDLGISRVQFQRYLKGESFPKPNLLQRICTHFAVDGRILLEPINKIAATEAARLDQPSSSATSVDTLDANVAALFGWCLQGHSSSLSQDLLPDGIYRVWVSESAKPDKFYCMAVQVGSSLGPRGAVLQNARSTRCYFDRVQFRASSPSDLKRRREVRGAMLGVPDGMIWMAFNPAPIYRITLAHFAPNPVVADGSFVGYVARGRAALPGFTRIARAFLEPVPRQMRSVLALCKTKPVYSAQEVPPAALDYICEPVQWRASPFSA